MTILVMSRGFKLGEWLIWNNGWNKYEITNCARSVDSWDEAFVPDWPSGDGYHAGQQTVPNSRKILSQGQETPVSAGMTSKANIVSEGDGR